MLRSPPLELPCEGLSRGEFTKEIPWCILRAPDLGFPYRWYGLVLQFLCSFWEAEICTFAQTIGVCPKPRNESVSYCNVAASFFVLPGNARTLHVPYTRVNGGGRMKVLFDIEDFRDCYANHGEDSQESAQDWSHSHIDPETMSFTFVVSVPYRYLF